MRVFFFLLFLNTFTGFAGNEKFDSLRVELAKAAHDTTRMKIFLLLGDEYFITDPQKSIVEIESALQLAEKHQHSTDPKVNRLARLKKAEALNNLGYVYRQLGDLGKAVEFYYSARKAYELTGDKRGLATTLNNIGVIYRIQKQPEMSLKNYEEARKLCEEIHDSLCIAQSLHSTGFAYKQMEQYDKALEYYHKSLEIRERINDKVGIGLSLNNIGVLYYTLGAYRKAKPYYQRSLEIRNSIGSLDDISMTLNNLGNLELELNNVDAALSYFLKSKQVNDQKFLEPYSIACKGLYQCYRLKGNYREALMYYEMHTQYEDSMSTATLQKETMKQQLHYEYQKKQLADSLRNQQAQKEKDLLLKQQRAQLSEERTQKYAFGGGMVLLLLLAGVTYNAYSNKKKTNVIIHQQKQVLEEKNKDITDSITYAKRIQDALLIQNHKLAELGKDHFILFRPRDIVSGDFYWSYISNDYLYICVADCTGHGVPGAFMSLLGITFLDEIMRTSDSPSPSEILNSMRNKIILCLQQTGEPGSNKDGMDIAMFRIQLRSGQVYFAGANNQGWICRKGKREIIALKPSKQPISFSERMDPFTDVEEMIESGDMLYLFSDGFADQFGGEKGKKFKYRPLQDLLVSGADLSCDEQRKFALKAFESWKGSLEQVDDVCLAGIRF